MTSQLSSSSIEQIRSYYDLVNVISEYTTLKQRGKSYVGLCPFHNEKTPSFTVSREKQLYYCFGCGAGGDLFNFIMSKEGLTFSESARMLAERAGIRIEEDSAAVIYRQKKEQIFQVMRQAALYYYKQLCSDAGKNCRSYLAARGIKAKTAQLFGLGFAPEGWENLFHHLTRYGFDKKLLFEAGLIQEKKSSGSCYDRFRNRLIFPIINQQGKVVGFGGRMLEGNDGPKYLNSPETELFNKGKLLYALNTARKIISSGEPAIVMEGYMDVISAHQAGFTNAVASLGTSLTETQARLLRRFTETVVIVYDADAAGQAAALRGMEILQQAGLIVKVASLPSGKDPDDYLRSNGSDSFRQQVLEKALLLSDYKLETIRSKYDLLTTEGKMRFKQEVIPFLSSLEGEVERETYIRKVAADLIVSPQSLQQDLRVNRRKSIREAHIGKNRNVNLNQEQKQLDLGNKTEQMALAILLRRSDLMERFGSILKPSYFTQPLLRQAVQKIEILKSSYSEHDIIKDFNSQEQALLTGLLFRDEYNHLDMDEEMSLTDCITRLIKNHLCLQEDRIRNKISSLIDIQGDPVEQKKLMAKLQETIKIKNQVKTMILAGQTLDLHDLLEQVEDRDFG